MASNSRDLLDINEAARLSGLDKGTLYKLARNGRLRSFKVLGTTLRFDRADVLALIEERPARQVASTTMPPTEDRD
jgi:excisionase family DNA binding protein